MTDAQTETPREAARRFAQPWIGRGYSPSALHTYRASNGEVLYHRLRLEHPAGDGAPDGSKIIRPFKPKGAGYELGEPEYPKGGKPLYHLDHICADTSAPVWICEGEKACEALTEIGAVATTSGGAKSAASADWTVLSGRECRLWPDNDEAGKGYVGDVANILLGLGCTLSCVDVARLALPMKGDAYDWAKAHQNATLSDLEALPRIDHQPLAENAPRAVAGVRVLNLAEFLAASIPPREEILAPWLLTQSLSMIFAWRGVGKTFVALNVAFAVATGCEFLGWKATKPRKVLYLDGEMAAAALQERLRNIVLADERDFDPEYLRLVTPDLQPGAMPDLATEAGQAAIEAIVGDAELIIVDNISTLVRQAGRENDAESWNDVGTWALRMRQRGRSVLFLHHSGKGGAQRGSSKKEDTLDAVVCLRHPADYSPEQVARFEVHFEKARNGGGAELKPFEATLGTDSASKPLWTFRTVEESTLARVVGLAVDGLSQRDIAEELEINKSNVSRHMRRARDLGMLPKEGK